jgi:2-polyprenyl-6-methoxyphenol hydroxylase-like FAD-dependent oxidoreductase
MARRRDNAIVIGAGIGGLLAARALADDFATVTLLERDTFPTDDISRHGAPQGDHAHVLLARGRNVIEALLPGWTDEVVAAGGVTCDLARDVTWISHGLELKPASSQLIGLLASRPVLEGHVRRRLLALPNVRAIERCAVQGLAVSADRSTVTGVCVRRGDRAETIAADLVVDASGHGSPSPAWLQGLGYARPRQERIDVGICYTTRRYRRRPADLGGRCAVVVAGSGPNWRKGAILVQSEDCWIVSVGGYFGDDACDNERMFAAYIGSLPTRDLYDIVAQAEPLGDFKTYRYPASLRRRYERLTRFPANYLVFADAICSFNPVYAQGMTVAAQQAVLLRDAVRAGSTDLARRFFNAAAAVIDAPWDIALGNDLRHPQIKGPRSVKVKVANWYVGKLHQAAETDSVLAGAFLRVANLEAQPLSLLHPAIVLRVVTGNLRHRRGIAASAAGARV